MGVLDFLSSMKHKSKAKAAFYASLFGNNSPSWSEQNFKAFVEEGYYKIVWVYACVRELYQSTSSVPWVAYRLVPASKSKARQNPAEWRNYVKKMIIRHKALPSALEAKSFDLEELALDHPLSRILKRPNPDMTWAEVMEVTSMHLNLAGKSFWEKVKGGGKTQEIYPIRPDRLIPKGSKGSFVDYFQIVEGGMDTERLMPEDVVYFRMPHPLDERGGFSPVQPASRTIDQENAASDWNKVFFENAGVPGGILISPTRPDDDVKRALREEWRMMYGGIKNAHKTAILWGGIEWKELAKTHQDMQFETLKRMTREEICATWGVPPPVIGIMDDSTYNNYETAKKSLWEETVVPQLSRVRDRLNMSIASEFGDEYFIDYDLSNVEALQENINDRFKRMSIAVGGPFMQPNEARQEVGYEPNPAFDVVYYGMGASAPGELPGQMTEPQPGDPNKEPKDDDEKKSRSFKADEGDEDRAQFWTVRERLRASWDLTLMRRIQDQFESELADIHELAENATSADELLRKIDEAVDFSWRRQWSVVITKNVTEVADWFGQQTWKDISGKAKVPVTDCKWDLFHSMVRSWIEVFIAKEVVEVTDTTKKKIRQAVTMSFEEGAGLTAAVKAIDHLYLDQIIPNRSKVIARTETHAASMAGSHYAAVQTGVNMSKTWISSRDSHVRDSHRSMDGKTMGINDTWEVRGSLMMFPGDTSLGASAKETIHCRCDEQYTIL